MFSKIAKIEARQNCFEHALGEHAKSVCPGGEGGTLKHRPKMHGGHGSEVRPRKGGMPIPPSRCAHACASQQLYSVPCNVKQQDGAQRNICMKE